MVKREKGRFVKGGGGNPTGAGRSTKPFRDALMVAINDKIKNSGGDKRKLRQVAETLVSEALDGNIRAIELISDRLDGKPKQETETVITGDPINSITLSIVDPVKTPPKIIEHDIIVENEEEKSNGRE